MEVVKIYNQSTGKQAAECTLTDIKDDGWTWEEFVSIQTMIGRTCIVEVWDVSD